MQYKHEYYYSGINPVEFRGHYQGETNKITNHRDIGDKKPLFEHFYFVFFKLKKRTNTHLAGTVAG